MTGDDWYTYDAWNRMVEVKEGLNVVLTNEVNKGERGSQEEN
jgi:hypothetical protein